MGLVARALEGALELVCPTRCAGCELPGEVLCEECADRVVRVDAALACRCCGAPNGRGRCSECGQHDFAFESARCVGPLVRPLSRLVTLYKDGGERRLAGHFASMVAEAAGSWTSDADCVSWIPTARSSVVRRGFDHSGLLAAQFSAVTSLPVVAALSTGGSRDQRWLDRESRQTNVRGAFSVTMDVQGRDILLLDDVMTTGATLDSAASSLIDAGALRVRALVVARKVASPEPR